jgi:hypothetical protein
MTLRIRRHDEEGMPEEVRLDKRTASRLTFLRTQWYGNVEHHVFRDPKTEEVYAQPTGRTAE